MPVLKRKPKAAKLASEQISLLPTEPTPPAAIGDDAVKMPTAIGAGVRVKIVHPLHPWRSAEGKVVGLVKYPMLNCDQWKIVMDGKGRGFAGRETLAATEELQLIQ